MAPPAATFHLARQILQMSGHPATESSPEDAVFVCIDCEAFEFAQDKVTEIGVAVLDTKDIFSIAPGADGEKWVEKMSYAHYRPVQYAHLVNRRWVRGAEDQFAFGDTIWINIQDASQLLSRIFRCPERLASAADFSLKLPNSQRNIIFVAHGLSNDDQYLTQLGFPLSSATNVCRKVDSQRVAGGTKKNSLGLKTMLEKLGVQYHGLHNGANDAAFTLQATVLMAVRESQQPGVVAGDASLPAVTLPGLVRAAGVSAPHVYGGTAVRPAGDLPIDGGKKNNGRRIKKATGAKKGGKSGTQKKDFSTVTNPSLDSSGKKRRASGEGLQDEQPARKKKAG